jgi:diguanylate cyclase (GGDEF)-like protein
MTKDGGLLASVGFGKRKGRDLLWAVTLLCTLTAVDAATGAPAALQLAFAVPCGLAFQRAGARAGIALAILTLAALACLDGGFSTGATLVRICALSSVALLTLDQERRLRIAIRAAAADPLTSAHSRLFAERFAEEAISRALRNGESLQFTVVDCDDFKRVNDICGHATGDEILRQLVHALRACVSAECIGRTGGDEFLLVTRGLDRAMLEFRLQAAQARFSDRTLVLGCKTSFSYGVSELATHGISLHALISSADSDMYARKRDLKQPHRSRPLIASA